MPWKRILLEGDAAVLTSTVTPVAVDFAAAAIGTSTEAARADHKHSAVAGSPVALDGLAADGTSTAFVRADHKHSFAPLAVDLNFNEHEADRMALDNLSAAAGYTTTKLGVIYFDTVDRHPYIYIG
jgi:hypothetical protein